MVLLAAIVFAAGSPPARQPRLQAIASVRIERPSSAGKETWDRTPKARRSEIIIRDDHGRKLLLRLIENQ
jgi:hypothetical protein